MVVYRGVEIGPELATSIRYMEQVEEYREALQVLQAVWDNLALLSHLSSTRIEIGEVRSAFSGLTSRLLNNLGSELRRKAVFELQAKAQVAIDILVRNLFERTADIGFLATDSDLRSFAQAPPAERERSRRAVLERFREYQRKYSVYANIILLSPSGEVLAQLDETSSLESSHDPLIAECLSTRAPYVESYRHSDLQPSHAKSLIYSYRVMSTSGESTVGVLCLSFLFADECQRIFEGLIRSSDWHVITLVDQAGCVIASSDVDQVPLGASIASSAQTNIEIVRFRGRLFLSTLCHSGGYQGYMGPGWSGHAMLPLEFAFGAEETALAQQVTRSDLARIMASETLFSESLRDIPRSASGILAELNRAVWNGNVELARDADANNSFSKSLLREIGNTGVRMRDVISQAIANLNETVVAAILRDGRSKAALSIDLMDRNLYERANDCRWWALTTAFRRALAGAQLDVAARQEITKILETINGLYTVYTNLVLFDARGCIVATSKPAYRDRVGQALDCEWVRETLSLRSTESYCVSPFETSEVYEDRHTYIYCAAVRAPDESARVVGGIAIVFDSAPQFRAMLAESLPRTETGAAKAGAFGLFVDQELQIVSSTRDDLTVGSRLAFDDQAQLADPRPSWEKVLSFEGNLYAVGGCHSSGYREYKGPGDPYRNEITSLVFVPLSTRAHDESVSPPVRLERKPVRFGVHEETIDIASFAVCGTWYALAASQVVEAVRPERIAPMPGAPDCIYGCVMYRDAALAVLDLARLLGRERAMPRAIEAQQIVIVDATPRHPRFGILVDDLGDNQEVSISRIVPISNVFQRHAAVVDKLVTPDPALPGDTMLMLLSIETLACSVQGAEPEAVPA